MLPSVRAERGYVPARPVMEQKGILPIPEKSQVRVVDVDELPADDWVDCRAADDASTGSTVSLKFILSQAR